MMTTEQGEQVVFLCLERCKTFWLLPSYWRIETKYGETETGRPAEVDIQSDYYFAKMIFDLEQMRTPKDLYEYAAHEFAHILTSDYDVLFKSDKRSCTIVERTTTWLEHVFLARHPFDM
jgi:hypothetical protein